MCNKDTFIKALREGEKSNLKQLYMNLFNSATDFINSNKNYKFEEEFEYSIGRTNLKYTLSFFELEKDKMDILKKLDINGYLFMKAYKIMFQIDTRAEDKSRYIVMTFYKYEKVYFNSNNIYASELKKISTIILNEDFSLFTNEIKGNMLPLTFSTLSKILKSFEIRFIENIFLSSIKIMLDFISKDKVFSKEIFDEYLENRFYIPIRINDVSSCYNKRNLIQLYFKRENIPKAINKFSLLKGYLLMKCRKYVKDTEFQKLYIIKDLDFTQLSVTVKESVIDFFTTYYEHTLGLKEIDEMSYDDDGYGDQLIRDYIRMTLMSDNRILNLKIKSYRRLCEEHNKISIKLRQKETKTIKIPKESKFKNLKLPKEFEEIKTKKRIVEESIKQNNCVWSYADDINKDKCRIYSTMYEGKRYTLEIRKRRNKFVLAQLYGVCNSYAPEELELKIKSMLKNI
ncbi:PcfJ domain-containing protein [Clostridium baratii]|uniref:PcfJ domain-containing protein n=1 Tax=Clostridium baratii TaxID=1561 RepID=UPI0030D47038